MARDHIAHILLGLDDGNLASAALNASMQLAEALGARLDLLHGVDLGAPSRGTGRAREWALESQRALEAARIRIEGQLAVTVAHPLFAELPVGDYAHVVGGKPAEKLIEFAIERGTDLIVLGRHRRRLGLDFGGLTQAVLSESVCPVWVQSREPEDIRRILVSVDLLGETERILEFTRLLASGLGARVDVLHCFPPVPAADEPPSATATPSYLDSLRADELVELERRVQSIEWGAVSVETLLVQAAPAAEILARQKDADLIVMGTHGRRSLVRAVLGSEASRVLKFAERPVVAIPGRRAASPAQETEAIEQRSARVEEQH